MHGLVAKFHASEYRMLAVKPAHIEGSKGGFTSQGGLVEKGNILTGGKRPTVSLEAG